MLLTCTRTHTCTALPRFKMAENIDSELKRMAQDLKEIIDQMNSANSNQDEESTVRQGGGGKEQERERVCVRERAQ